MSESCVADLQDRRVLVRNFSVLIVDDDPSCQILFKKSIEKSPIRHLEIHIECAATKKEMLVFLHEKVFDIILLDLHLPDGDDLDMIDQINKQFPSSAILVITGESDESVGLTAMSYGAQDYLIKGEFNSKYLIKAIRFAIERKKNQLQTEKALKELAKAHKQIQAAQSQIIQNEKMASIGQLAAGVAHEMNTPVGFVASNFETLQQYLQKIRILLDQYAQICTLLEKDGSPEILEKILEIRNFKMERKIDFILEDIDALFEESREGLQRVTTIIQNLRDFSRIDQCTDMGEYDLNEGIKSTLVVARNDIKYDTEMTTDLKPIPRITCNAGQVNQVLLNILVNASQAIRTQKREDLGKICIQTSEEEDYIVCKITDDGPGIPEEIVSRIFDPFFTTKPAGKGTGLGLSVSYDIIVNKHKGRLLVESELGKGTTFTIKLPKEYQDEIRDEFSENETAENTTLRENEV